MSNREIFARYILDEFKDKLTGENQDRIVGKKPEDLFFIGQLAPKSSEEESYSSSKIDISQIGMDFYVNSKSIEGTKLIIQPKGNMFFKVMPTYEEQNEKILKQLNKYKDIETIKIGLQEFNKIKGEKDKENIFKVEIEKAYEKFVFDDQFKLEIDLKDILGSLEYGNAKYSLNRQIDGKIKGIATDKIYKVIKDKLTIEDLKSEVTFNKFIIKNSKESNIPTPDIEVGVAVKKLNDQFRITINLVNRTEPERNRDHCNTIFNGGLEVEVLGNEILPFKLNYFKDDYKYDDRVHSQGNNCSTKYIYPNIIITENIPIYEQNRLKTKDTTVVATFNELIENPIKKLKDIQSKMNEELNKWNLDFNIYKENNSNNNKGIEQYQNEIKAFEFEINRFSYGIKQIEHRNGVRDCFISMNKTFKLNSGGKFNSWRLFQIVFIVSLIPDVLISEYGEEEIDLSKIDHVDLLYFPTGGGKTEAFLGVTVFTLFFDRYRQKDRGTSAIIKYPLRLLSIQQVERLTKILAAAEKIRMENIDKYPGDRFSSGYFVGDGNTPNKLTVKDGDILTTTTKEKLNEKYRVIDICPFCGKKNIDAIFDKDRWRLIHICNTPNCSSEGELPLYTVDREIFRYLPSVIVSTIDKIASIGLQSNFRNILGEISLECPKHGITSKNECTEKDICQEDIAEFEQICIKDGAPSLIIQDEVHLLREGLGTYNSHYETLVDYFTRFLTNSRKKLKFIGATATVTDYAYQIHELYFKDAIRFPCASPYIDENFYSKIDKKDLNRLLISYAPYGRAIVNSVVYSMKYFREVLWKYFIDSTLIGQIPGIIVNTKEEAFDILKDYWIFIEYNNVKRDSNRVEGALENPINLELRDQKISPFEMRKMTGDSGFQDVRQVLSEIDNYSSNEVFEGINLISATSMISHGVDASKFNVMFFFGMPGNTAEYIQAYSRTGRTHPGIVIDIMRPTRDRDLSYLKYFKDFHEYKDILVEPVPINRWANKAIYSTFPGILSALILNYYDFKLKDKYKNLYMDKNIKNAIENGDISQEKVKKQILEIYKCILNDNTLPIGKNYSEVIEKGVDTFFQEMRNQDFDGKGYITNLIDELLTDFRKPMTSLRDTDTNVTIELT
ncbi:DEAD/DEAH box helicase family protein [uncultured Ilyobacter sp.]|uniref:DEAD/DEAH box helicase family protein n=1 Tax=uncultured Ilyobacter sp. TaxID=544433 RepID=UPI002AA70E0D|nr:DEAD/DEAH box helicase family protein [uncultured Ilyobacter sp.]